MSAEGGATRAGPGAFSSTVGHLLFSGIATLALIVDQVTKAWVVAMLSPNETTQLARWLAPILSLTR